jgi:hypothetical protein
MKFRWMPGPDPKNETFVLFSECHRNLIAEWRVAGYVMLRQVYPRLPPTYHIFECDLEDASMVSLGTTPNLHEAKLRLARTVTEHA